MKLINKYIQRLQNQCKLARSGIDCIVSFWTLFSECYIFYISEIQNMNDGYEITRAN